MNDWLDLNAASYHQYQYYIWPLLCRSFSKSGKSLRISGAYSNRILPTQKRASPLAESSGNSKNCILTSFSVWRLLKTKWCILSLPCTYHSNHNPRRKLCGLLWDIKKLIGIVLRSKKVQTIRNAVEWKIHNSSIRRYVHLIVGEILIHGFILILTFVLFVLSFLTSFLTYISSIHLCAVVNSVELLINCLSSHFF